MFDVYKIFRPRVRIRRRGSTLRVRIERKNRRSSYFHLICVSTGVFAFICSVFYRTAQRNPDDILYILPFFVLVLIGYGLALAIAVWGAFGIAEITVERGLFRWRRTALKWTRTRDIRTTDITDIRAITSWYRMGNRVEITAAGTPHTIGDELLRDEALQLAHDLRLAIPASSDQHGQNLYRRGHRGKVRRPQGESSEVSARQDEARKPFAAWEA
ncbi:MAG TPA: hypothetical protein VKZ53_30970 [Candidatus Angelobacter sp.]|nr:hypothetical protein [Candidatus Angelobacter sp.]